MPSCLCLWHHEWAWHGWQRCQMLHEPTFFCSSLAKSEPTWRHPEKIRVEAVKYVCGIDMDTTTIWILQVEILIEQTKEACRWKRWQSNPRRPGGGNTDRATLGSLQWKYWQNNLWKPASGNIDSTTLGNLQWKHWQHHFRKHAVETLTEQP